MDIPSLIQLLQNKVNILSNAKALAFSSGDLDRMNAIENDLLSTQNTMSQLQMLLAATQAANAQNLDLSSVVTAGVQAAQASSLIPDAPTAVLSQYDLSTYAADPAYLQKISDMLAQMPTLDTAPQIDTYISNEIVGSPITGQMVIDATTKYAVDTRLTVAIMELDSRLGTAGTGASTFNPGNVGNTGTSITTFASWSDGVAAVAYWLSKHRTGGPVPVTVVPDTTATDATTTPNIILPIDTTTSTSTTATTTQSVATSTPPIVLPPVPVTTVSTTTAPVTVTVTASSTDSVGTTTITTTTASSTNATSTQSFNLNDPTASSTNATSTLNIPPFTSTSTDATSTGSNSTGSSTPSTGTTTPPLDLGNIGNGTSTTPTASSTTPVVNPTSSSTPDTNASTTQARRTSKRNVV